MKRPVPVESASAFVLVRLSRADDAAVGPDGSPHPLPLFDDLRVCLVYDFAHFRERLPAPVPKFLDLLVDFARIPLGMAYCINSKPGKLEVSIGGTCSRAISYGVAVFAPW